MGIGPYTIYTGGQPTCEGWLLSISLSFSRCHKCFTHTITNILHHCFLYLVFNFGPVAGRKVSFFSSLTLMTTWRTVAKWDKNTGLVGRGQQKKLWGFGLPFGPESVLFSLEFTLLFFFSIPSYFSSRPPFPHGTTRSFWTIDLWDDLLI